MGIFANLAVKPIPLLFANHRHSLHSIGNIYPRQIQQRGHNILPPHQAIIHAVEPDPLIASRPQQNHRNIGRSLVEKPLCQHIVIAQHIAVIRRKTNNRIVEQSLLPQRPNQHAQAVVNMGTQGIKRTPRHLDLNCTVLVSSRSHRLKTIGKISRVNPIAHKRRINLHIPIKIQVLLQRHNRRMWMPIRNKPERRARRISPFDKSHHVLSRPVCRMGFIGQMPGHRAILVITHTVIEVLARIALITQKKLVIVENPILRTPLFV